MKKNKQSNDLLKQIFDLSGHTSCNKMLDTNFFEKAVYTKNINYFGTIDNFNLSISFETLSLIVY